MVSPSIHSLAINDIIDGKTNPTDRNKSQIAVFCITATMNLFNFIVPCFTVAIRMIESPTNEDRSTTTRKMTIRHLVASLRILHSSNE